MKPDHPPMPRGVKKDRLVVARELPMACKFPTERARSLKSAAKMGLTISRPSPRLSKCKEPLEQSNKTILSREFRKGNSLMSAKPSCQTTLALAPPKHANFCAIVKPPDKKVEISPAKGMSTTKCSPGPKAALTLPKSTPIPSVWALPAHPAKDVAPPSSQVVLMLGTSNEISPHRVGSLKTRHAVEARTRVSMKPASPRFGEMPSAGVLEHFEKCSVVATRHAVKQASMLYPSKMKGKQQVLDSVVSINEGINGTRYSPCPSATSTLPASAPITPTHQEIWEISNCI